MILFETFHLGKLNFSLDASFKPYFESQLKLIAKIYRVKQAIACQKARKTN